jgi:Protein of unknown function DUF262/Protein of unknown function (DUF1524)
VDVSLKVTDQPQETSFFDMVGGDSVLSIPLFQRPYRWAEKNLDWLVEDIDDIRLGVTRSCFLGVVVCVSRGATPGRPIPWEIVDGQQRLSTLYLLLMAATEVAAKRQEYSYAAGVLGTYLLVRPMADNPVNTKLVPSIADRGQFKKIWDGIMAIEGLMAEPSVVGNKPRPPAPAGAEEGAMLRQYNRMKRNLNNAWAKEGNGLSWLQAFVDVAASKLSVVSISLRDPMVAPKIFERLNNRAELVTVADLVRNEVFALTSADAAAAQHVFTNLWEPFSSKFSSIDKGLEKFLFPYGLIINRNVTKADLFTHIRARWQSLAAPADIIEDMRKYTGTFLALEAGIPEIDLPASIQTRINRIHRLGKPSSVYAFLMRLVHEMKSENLLVEICEEVLDVVESFLFRRAICGIEPTGLHAVFKGLWAELTEGDGAAGVTGQSVQAAIASKPTVSWPSNENFADAIRTTDLYSRKVNKFALREYEEACEGESPSDDFQIEHICPQTSTEIWGLAFGNRYEELVNTWANLIPLTGRMNNEAGQLPFSEKSEEYSNSIFASTRHISTTFTSWTPPDVDVRAETLVKWALERWPWERTNAQSIPPMDATAVHG